MSVHLVWKWWQPPDASMTRALLVPKDGTAMFQLSHTNQSLNLLTGKSHSLCKSQIYI
jgi:hypothetical protein